MIRDYWVILVCAFSIFSAGCANQKSVVEDVSTSPVSGPRPQIEGEEYLIGPGDQLQIFVWRNPELSSTVPVRPDGKITTPLVEDVNASGKTATELAREMEKRLAFYVKNPIVTVTVQKFVGRYSEQIRVVGEAATPKSLSYSSNMTLLDVIIDVGGLTEFADDTGLQFIRINIYESDSGWASLLAYQ